MSLTLVLTLNALLGLLTIAAVSGLMLLARRLPSDAPQDDEAWGRTGDPWVVSEPLPRAQVALDERRRRLARAA